MDAFFLVKRVQKWVGNESNQCSTLEKIGRGRGEGGGGRNFWKNWERIKFDHLHHRTVVLCFPSEGV